MTGDQVLLVARMRVAANGAALPPSGHTFSRAYGLQPSSGATASGEQASTIGPGRTFGRDPNDLTNPLLDVRLSRAFHADRLNVFVDPRRAMLGVRLNVGRR